MAKYITYESPYANQIFTKSEMHNLYKREVNKNEYTTYKDWLADMVNSGVFETL